MSVKSKIKEKSGLTNDHGNEVGCRSFRISLFMKHNIGKGIQQAMNTAYKLRKNREFQIFIK